MNTSIKPLEDRVAIRRLAAETVSPGGIVIPDAAQEKPQEGVVIAVGPGRHEHGVRVPVDVEVGDRVVFSRYGATEVKLEGEELLVLGSKDVIAILA